MAVPRHARAAFFPDISTIKTSVPRRNPPSPTFTQATTNQRNLDIVYNYANDESENTLVPDFPSPPLHRAFTPVPLKSEPRSEKERYHYSTYPESLWSDDQKLENQRRIVERDSDDEQYLGDDIEDPREKELQMRQIAKEYQLRSGPGSLNSETWVGGNNSGEGNNNTMQRAPQDREPWVGNNTTMQRPLDRDAPQVYYPPSSQSFPPVPEPVLTTRPLQQPQRAVWFASHLISPNDSEYTVPPTPPSSPTDYTMKPVVPAQQRSATLKPVVGVLKPVAGLVREHQQRSVPQLPPRAPQRPFDSVPLHPFDSVPLQTGNPYASGPQDTIPNATPRRLANFLNPNPAQPTTAPADSDKRSLATTLWKTAKTANKVRKALSPTAIAARIAIVALVINMLILDVLIVVFAVRVLPSLGRIEAFVRSVGGKL